MRNVEVVQEIYAAFGRGDVPAILNRLSEDVEWEYAYRSAPPPVPWLQPARGRQGAAAFFKSLQDRVEFHRFSVNALAEAPGLIIALTDVEFTVRSTGKRIGEQDEAHVWHFDDQGMVVRFRHCADTYQQVMASRA